MWVAVWRFVVVLHMAAIALFSGMDRDMLFTLAAAAGYAAVTGLIALLRPTWGSRVPALVIDVAACSALFAVAAGHDLFASVTLYAFSTIVASGARRPLDAFVSALVVGCAFVGVAVTGDGDVALGSGIALFLFFAIATAGFFTVVRRIGALEVATEISRERGRYRRDLHDRLGQALCGLHFELQAVHADGPSDDVPQRMGSLADGYRSARSMLDEFFRQVEDPMLATSVAALITQEASRLSEQSGSRIAVMVDGDAARIPPWMRPHIWSVAGECMTNALKNGQAQSIEIELAILDEMLVLSVTDDGVGFDCPPGDIPDMPGHYGLREMQERARLCGGEVVVASAPGFGTRVRLQAPIPEDSTGDILERDVGTLRSDIWNLVIGLRTALGAVAAVQLALLAGDVPALLWIGLLAGVLVDAVVPTFRSTPTRLLLRRSPWVALIPVAGYATALALCLTHNVTPYFMLYAPLMLLALAVSAGRRICMQVTVAFAMATAIAAYLAHLSSSISGDEARTTLTYVTNMLIVGMSAAQGAKLLDRLEALQIRVRYQALARLRQGLSSRMRDRLTSLLDVLEGKARDLMTGSVEPKAFAETTELLEEGSSELKARLREIVHQLADPPSPPGRTHSHV
jgi:signal transduction histidine kinase